MIDPDGWSRLAPAAADRNPWPVPVATLPARVAVPPDPALCPLASPRWRWLPWHCC